MNFFALLIIAGFSLLFYFTGSLFLYLSRTKLPKDTFYASFLKLIIGLLLILFLYAAIVTEGNTVLWGFVLVGLLYLSLKTKQITSSNNIGFNEYLPFKSSKLISIGIILLLCIIFFVFQGSFFYAEPYNNLTNADYTFYSKVSYYMNFYAYEGLSHISNPFLTDSGKAMPYHYPELWLTALICKVCGTLYLETQVVIVYSILGVILSIGMIAVCRLFTKSVIMQILAVLSVYLSGILFFTVLPQAETFIYANASYHKMLIVSVLFVWFVLLATHSRYYYFVLLLIPITSIATTPAVFSAVVIMAVYLYFRKKIDLKNGIKMIASTVLVFIFIVLFYYLQSGGDASGAFKPDSIIDGLLIDKLKPIKIIAGTIIIIISLYFYYFLPAVMTSIKKNLRNSFKDNSSVAKETFLFFVIMFICGLLSWSVSHPITNSVQFFYKPVLLLLNIIVFVVFAITYKTVEKYSKKISYILILYFTILIGINFYYLPSTQFHRFEVLTEKYSEKYIKELKEFLDNTPELNKNGANIKAPEELVGYWAVVPYMGMENHIWLFADGFNTVSLNTLYTPIDKYEGIEKNRAQSLVENAIFTKFASDYLENKPDTSIDDLQYLFVKQHKIEYLIISGKAEIPASFLPEISLIIEDDVSGERFVVLR